MGSERDGAGDAVPGLFACRVGLVDAHVDALRHGELRQDELPLQGRPPTLHGHYLQWTRTVTGRTVTKILSVEQPTATQVASDVSTTLTLVVPGT